MLKMGRVALVYQTSDGEQTGMWNSVDKNWEALGDEYTAPVRNGIRMARQQLAPRAASPARNQPAGGTIMNTNISMTAREWRREGRRKRRRHRVSRWR